MPTDDLAPFMVPRPAGRITYGQGKIISWNPETFEHVIERDRVRLTNLPLLNTTDALSYAPGQTLALVNIDSSGARGATQWAILGRWFIPGTDNAESLVDWMTTALGRRIAAAVFADRIKTDVVLDNETGAPAVGFGDLTTPGPTLNNVEVTETGKLIAFVSARIGVITGAGQPYVGVELTGPMEVPAFFDGSLHLGSTTDPGTGLSLRATSCVAFTDLLPGSYQVQVKYHGDTAFFRDRELMSIAL